MSKKILVTGGHLTPAIAVIENLQEKGYDNFLWVGHKYNQSGTQNTSAEYNWVLSKNIEFIELKTGKLVRSIDLSNLFYAISNLFKVITGQLSAFFILLKHKPDLILSFGGYLAVPIAFAGKFLRIKIIAHEQTVTVGLSNRLISRFADKILISWLDSKKYFKNKNVVHTGNPIRKEFIKPQNSNLTAQFKNKLPILFITGGNQGANEINSRIHRLIEDLVNDFNIIHQTGNSTVTKDYGKALALSERLDNHLKDRYIVKDYLTSEEFAESLQNSNIVISRGGANTIQEIMFCGKLALIIPIPWVEQNEQSKNAKLLEATGLGLELTQNEELTPEVLKQKIYFALDCLNNNTGFNDVYINDCINKAKEQIKMDATENVVTEVLEYL